MKKVPFYDLRVTGGFWAEKQKTVRDTTVRAVYDRFEETGRIATMDCKDHGIKPHFFWGSDVVKWMEGAAYILEQHDDPDLREKLDELIRAIESGMTGDGNYNSYFNSPLVDEDRFTDRDRHELYSLGHLMEAAVALAHLGDRRLMRVAEKNALLVRRLFCEEESAAFVTPGHEEIELALYRMYETTGDGMYLDLAEFFIRKRGANDKDRPIHAYEKGYGFDYDQAHLPVTEQKTAEGHAVRALYLYCGMADLAERLEDDALHRAVRTLFDDIYEKKMYITGGVGSNFKGERFTLPYHLPNRDAYAETCAALALALFAARLYRAEPDGKFGDAAERAIFNGMIAGLSLSGDAFFYTNPLEMDRARAGMPQGYDPKPVRQKVFKCSCCPPNLVRMIPSIADLVYSYNEEYLFVHQYIATVGTADGMPVRMETDYPADGKVKIECKGKKLVMRRPAWCRDVRCDLPYREEKGYLYFDTDRVEIEFVMAPVFYTASHNVHEDAGRVALMRGPIVYCIEGKDQPEDVFRLRVDADAPVAVTEETYGGLPVLTAAGEILPEKAALYTPYVPADPRSVVLRFIPYYAFANRGADDMQVWILQK